MSSSRPKLVALSVTALSLVLAVSAFAWLGSTGSNSSNAATNISRIVTISGGAVSQNVLPTGAATGDLTVTLQNANASARMATSLVLDTSRGSGGYGATALNCSVTYTPANGGVGNWSVSGKATRVISLANSVTMGTNAPDTCQGSTFIIYLKVA